MDRAASPSTRRRKRSCPTSLHSPAAAGFIPHAATWLEPVQPSQRSLSKPCPRRAWTSTPADHQTGAASALGLPQPAPSPTAPAQPPAPINRSASSPARARRPRRLIRLENRTITKPGQRPAQPDRCGDGRLARSWNPFPPFPNCNRGYTLGQTVTPVTLSLPGAFVSCETNKPLPNQTGARGMHEAGKNTERRHLGPAFCGTGGIGARDCNRGYTLGR